MNDKQMTLLILVCNICALCSLWLLDYDFWLNRHGVSRGMVDGVGAMVLPVGLILNHSDQFMLRGFLLKMV